MKLFEVSIDNNPGGWKSGNDNHVLVLAETKEDAIEKVKDGYSKTYGNYSYTYGNFEGKNEYIAGGAKLHATEIKFEGYDYIPVREAKLKRILKDET